jgi:hypothetical protein
MLSHVCNYQVTLLRGGDRYVAATHLEEAESNLIFFCWDRIVHRQPKEEMQSFRELRQADPNAPNQTQASA